MLSHASRLHGFGVAHCDIGDHSVWLELPATVRFSHLFAARIPEGRTVAEERYSTLAKPVVYPEDFIDQPNNLLAKDVFLLACVAHLLLLGTPPKAEPGEPAMWDPALDANGEFTSLHPWLAKGLEMDVGARFPDAAAMLDAFNIATKPIQADADTLERLYRFRTHKNLRAFMRAYPQDDDAVVETDRVTVYPSSKDGHPLMIKQWGNINWRDERSDGARLLAFCERVRDLADLGLEGICPIHEVVYFPEGIAVVQDRVDAPSLHDVLVGSRDTGPFREPVAALNFLERLIRVVDSLHAQGFAHGDLTFTNILCPRQKDAAGEEVRPILIDVVDLSAHGEGERYTQEFAPKGSSTAAERDRCAVLIVAERLLTWSQPSEDMTGLAEAMRLCRTQVPVFGTLAPFAEALEALRRPAGDRLVLRVARPSGVSDDVVLRPDAGEYHLYIKRHGLQVTLHVTGANARLEIPLDASHRPTKTNLIPLAQDEIWTAQRLRCDSVDADIKLLPDTIFDPDSVQPLLDRPEIVKALNPGVAKEAPAKPEEEVKPEVVDQDPFFLFQETEADLDREADEAMLASLANWPEPIGSGGSEPSALPPDPEPAPIVPPAAAAEATATPEPAPELAPAAKAAPVVDVANLWRTLMDVEMEDIVEAEVDREPADSSRGTFVVRYRLLRGRMDFDAKDRVKILVMNRRGEWIKAGDLDLAHSRAGEAVVIPPRYSRTHISERFAVGGLMRFESQKSQESRNRKERAITRILKGDAAISNLLGYFTHHNAGWAKPMKVGVPDPERLRKDYDLNDSQIGSFMRLWTTGPLGLLQGPPGTGKTTFIAAFVHYALTEGGMTRILLVSQSHEAVDNAAKGVIDRFHRTGKPISLVRVGNKADVQSDTVRPYHKDNLEERYREEFRARLKEKVMVVGRRLGLDTEFLEKFHTINLIIRPILKNIEALAKEADSQEIPPFDPAGERARKRIDLEETAYRLLDHIGITALEISAAGYRVLHPGQADIRAHATDGQSDDFCEDPDAFDSTPDPEDEVLDLASPDAFAILTEVLSRIVYGARAIVQPDTLRRLLSAIELMDNWLGMVSSRHRNIEEFLVNTRQVVCGTCVGIGSVSLGIQRHFDLVIIDEAARATAGELAVPMHLGKRVLLVGDHKQLPPFHIGTYVAQTARRTKLEREEVRRSDFERAFTSPYGKDVGQTLRTQYRMMEPIGRLVSDVFYEESPLDHGRTAPKAPPEIWPDDLSRSIIWLDTRNAGREGFEQTLKNDTTRRNRSESRAIFRLLQRLDAHAPFHEWLCANKASDKPLEVPIGIICTYKAQVELIESSLVSIGLSPTLREAIRIDTVDSYQGKENLMVILSLVRNNDRGPPADSEPWTIKPGFLSWPNRINVAISRAMDRLVIVGTTKGWFPGSPMAKVVDRVNALAGEDLALLSDAKGN
ncbi:hypothetical protein [Azospirillum argentinense]|uniref:AAA domain-containing protein n=1 Tax=Azospirillum argentinense TaxID=2970906 RepID=UPI0032DEDB4F